MAAPASGPPISVFSVLCLLVAYGCCFAQVNWTWRHPYPTGSSMAASASDGKTTVAVGAYSTILSSDNDTDWTIRYSGGTRSLSAVTYGNNRFYVSGGPGLILTSQNLADWTVLPFDSVGHYLRGICWTGSQLVAVSAQGGIFTSSDGTSWTLRLMQDNNHGFTAVAAFDDLIVAAGWRGTVAYSSNGITWTPAVTDTTVTNQRIFRKDNLFIIGGDYASIFTSNDAATWTRQFYRSGKSDPISGIVYADTQFVATCERSTLTSPDGITWKLLSTSATTGIIKDLRWNGRFFTAFCQYGRICTSFDAINWVHRTAASNTSLTRLFESDGTILAFGNGYTLSSTDLMKWQLNSVVLPGYTHDMIQDEDQFIAVGSSGYANDCLIATSPVGNNLMWTKHCDTSSQLYAIAKCDSLYVAVGADGMTARSHDGADWEMNSSGNPYTLRAVAWTGTQIVAVGDDGTVTTSVDGRIWTARTSNTFARLNAIVWAKNQLIATGDSGVVLTSVDGRTWKRQPVTNARRYYALAWTGKQYVAVGETGAVMASQDGERWWYGTAPEFTTLYALLWTGERLLAAGMNGSILSSMEELVIPTGLSNVTSNRSRPDCSRHVSGGNLIIRTPTSSSHGPVDIYTVEGRRLRTLPSFTDDRITVPVASLPPGCYLVRLSGGVPPERRLIKFVKNR